MDSELCEYLRWDSDFFRLRVGRLKTAKLSPEVVRSAEQWCHDQRIDCLYFLAGLDDTSTVRIAQDRAFRLMDVRVTLEARAAAGSPLSDTPGSVRRFREEDLPALRQLARVSHRNSRFYLDPRFPNQACDRFYETWIENSCRGWADAVFVTDLGAGPVGYATAHRAGGTLGSLGLIAVDTRARGMGLGRQLTEAVLDWCRHERLEVVRVVTQGSNCQAMRLYARCGFLPQSLQLWYHRWFSSPDSVSYDEE